MRPPMKKIDYKVGDKVEVCSKEEGFMGSYYEATIASCLDNGRYVIRYKNLLKDDES
ncbi:RNA binding protein, partial [Trifolium pratense]